MQVCDSFWVRRSWERFPHVGLSFHRYPQLPHVYMPLCSLRWWKSTACWLWGCLCGTSWSCRFSLCVSGFCCLPCRSTPTSAPEISLPQEKGSCFSFLPGKTTAAAAASSLTVREFFYINVNIFFCSFFKTVISKIHLCTSVGSCPQYCRMLQYAILPAGPRFHSLLYCSGSSYPLQVLPSRLPSLHEWQHHAQVWVGAWVYTPVILSVFGCSVEHLACPRFVSAGGWQKASRCWSSLSRPDLLNFRSFTERSSCPSSSSLSLLPSCSRCWR